MQTDKGAGGHRAVFPGESLRAILVFTSGQIPLNPRNADCLMVRTVTEQTHRVCKNLEAVLCRRRGIP